jgi:F-box and leucine-rich repeat protein GRR1
MRSRQRSSSAVPNRTGSGSSSCSSPERILDDDQDIMMINDDSQTSIGDLTGFRDMTVSPSQACQKQTQPPSPVYRLPPEILMSVFNKISSPADLRNCMLVSKQWASCSVELLWHRPYLAEFRKYELMVRALMAERGFFMYPQLIRRLNLNFIADKINDGSMDPLVRCTRLERLTLTNCSRLTDHPLVKILENNQRIQALDLSQLESITDKSMQTVADNCPRLQGLNIAGCKLITDASLIPLSENRRMLRRVINCARPQ